MTHDAASPTPARAERTAISCPGCGRHDYVVWPADRDTFHWKCFNCHKEFDLARKAGH
jgi:transposase-like protein